MSDTPDRVSADDVRGLRTETGRLATSIETLAARQNITDATIKQKADKSLVEENRRLSRRANVNSFIAVIAVAVGLLGIFLSWRSSNDRIDQILTVRAQSRSATCAVFQAYTDALATTRAPQTQAQHDQIVSGLEAFLARVNPKLAVINCTLTPTAIPNAPGG